HFARADIAPAARDVAFVLALVKNDWLAEGFAPLRYLLELIALNAGVGHPGLGVIVHHSAVMDRAQTLIRIAGLDDAKKAIPIGERFGLHEVPFVRERPPHVPVGRQAGSDIAQI